MKKLIKRLFYRNDVEENSYKEKDVSFTKEDNGRWYVDYPGWRFSHANLEMVAGADTMCQMLSYDGRHTDIHVIWDDKAHPELADYIEFKSTTSFPVSGCDYTSSKGDIWLCPVTLFVLGEFPKFIYVKRNL